MVNLDVAQKSIDAQPRSLDKNIIQAAFDELVWFRENFEIIKEGYAAEADEIILETACTMVENAH